MSPILWEKVDDTVVEKHKLHTKWEAHAYTRTHSRTNSRTNIGPYTDCADTTWGSLPRRVRAPPLPCLPRRELSIIPALYRSRSPPSPLARPARECV